MAPSSWLYLVVLAAACAVTVQAQPQTSSTPLDELRIAEPSPILLIGAEVIQFPGAEPRQMDILIRGTTIVAVGDVIDPPPGAERRNLSGKRIHAGLIDVMHEVEVSKDSSGLPKSYWNSLITPEAQSVAVSNKSDPNLSKYRSQGFTAQVLAPQDGIIKGSSCLVLLLDTNAPQRLLQSNAFQHATLTVPRSGSRGGYPNSPMGATALFRQSLYDAIWYQDANQAFRKQKTLPRPEPSIALEKLGLAIKQDRWVIDAANERMAIRAINVVKEFSLDAILRGSGREYRAIDELAKLKPALVLPVNFPDPPSTKTAASIIESSLMDWMHWHLAPENLRRVDEAGIEFCLTSDGLEEPDSFLKQVRVAVERGLSPVTALASLTTTPAKWLGIEKIAGRVDSGMLANLVITDGDLFEKKTRVVETWIAGQRFAVNEQDADGTDSLEGKWIVSIPASTPKDNDSIDMMLVLKRKGKSLSGDLQLADVPSEDEVQTDEKSKDETKPSTAKLENIIRQRERMSASVQLHSLSDKLPAGVSHLSVVIVQPSKDAASEPHIVASLTLPDGSTVAIPMRRDTKNDDSSDQPSKDGDESASEQDKSSTSKREELATEDDDEIELNYPLGPYGLTQTPVQPSVVLFQEATVWTCGPDGKLESTDILVRSGKIAEIGQNLSVPTDCVIIDAKEKHITPGIIDCHSHIATDGGVNESGQLVTAEVRIGDFIDNSDISIYRQLAGGVTTANILHGSANPIGGQSQVLKLRWGGTMDEMKFANAPAGIKFALGENVKRDEKRYPNTRMGVEQILRDQFLAARQYEMDWQAWQRGERDRLPPRRDLQLEALLEVQQGKRWVHCHSYRQDEIIATLDVLEEFNIQIGTLQHILEGYKVADRMASHGAMASTFADWWAYKFEVYDAIPYNGLLMHDASVVVSYNSDDAELARHLNAEAAKATKYGGVPEEEALKFVTLNPAKQLRIDERVGSIEIGKDADLVIWSGRPLSTMSRCEATWIDGREYFSLAKDEELRKRDRVWKSQLIQMAVDRDSEKESTKSEKEVPEEERWLRYDVFCNAGKNTGEVAK